MQIRACKLVNYIIANILSFYSTFLICSSYELAYTIWLCIVVAQSASLYGDGATHLHCQSINTSDRILCNTHCNSEY